MEPRPVTAAISPTAASCAAAAAFLNCHHPTLHLTSDFALCFEGYLRGVYSLLRCEVSCSFGLWAGCSGMQAVMQSCRGALRVEKGQKRRGHAVTEGIGTPGMYL